MKQIPSPPAQQHVVTQQTLFPLLAKRGIAAAWATAADARSAVVAECQKLANDAAWMASLKLYLDAKPIVRASCESMLAQLALAAGVKWQDTAPVLQPLSRRGWHLGRWLPTFLLINGPLGQLLKDEQSPLAQRLRVKQSGLPLLCAVKDAFKHDTFRQVRNGFAHWSFEWVDRASDSELRIVNWKTGEETARLSLLECEALHHLTFTVVQAIDENVFAKLG